MTSAVLRINHISATQPTNQPTTHPPNQPTNHILVLPFCFIIFVPVARAKAAS